MRARRRRRRACIASALLLDLLDDLFSANARRWARCRFDAGPASQKVGRHWPALARCLAFDGLALFLSYYITTVAQLLANPGRHRALVWHLYGVGPTSSTLVQNCTDVGWCSVFAGMQVHIRPVPWRVYTGIFYDKGTLSLAFCWFRAGPKLATLAQLWTGGGREKLAVCPRLGHCCVILPRWYNTDSDNDPFIYFIYLLNMTLCFKWTWLSWLWSDNVLMILHCKLCIVYFI